MIGEIYAVSAAFCWTINALLLESAGKKTKTNVVNFLRLCFGLFFLTTYLLITSGHIIPAGFTSPMVFFLMMSGVIGFVIGDYFLIRSMVMVGTRIAMLMMSLSPPITAVLDYLIFKETLSAFGLLGMLVTLLGIGIVIGIGRDDGRRKMDKRGLLYGFIGAVGQSAGLMFSKVGMGQANPFAASQIRVFAAVLCFVLFFQTKPNRKQLLIAVKDRWNLFKIACSGALGPFVGVGLSLAALQHTQAGIASTLNSLMPVMVLPFSICLLKEKVHLREIMGTIVAVCGVGILFLR